MGGKHLKKSGKKTHFLTVLLLLLLLSGIVVGGKILLQQDPSPSPPSEETEDPPQEQTPAPLALSQSELTVLPGQSDSSLLPLSPYEAASLVWNSSDSQVAAVDAFGRVTGVSGGDCVITASLPDHPEISVQAHVRVRDVQYDNGTWIDGVLIANKTYALPADYNPGANPEAMEALDELFAAGEEAGLTYWIASGFRSYQRQETIYNRYVNKDGQAEADRYSARPGHSEHQTGLAFDLNVLEQSFGETPEGIWLAENCWRYGFIIRYPQEKEDITGYMYEPWHVRYLGKDLAQAVYESGLCLEEYLGITSCYPEE